MDEQPNVTQPDNPLPTPPTPPEALTPAPPPVAPQSPIPQAPVTANASVPQQDPSQFPSVPNPTPQAQPPIIQPLQNPAPESPLQPTVSASQGVPGAQSMKQPNKRKVMLPILLVVVLAAVAGGVFALKGPGSSAKLSCTPPSGSTVNETVAITAFKAFTEAVRSSNQACANTLSSNYFLDYSKQEFATPSGNWIASNPSGMGSMASGFSKLPTNLINSQFVKKAYSRAQVETANGSVASYYTPATGLTMGYPSGTRDGNGNGGSVAFYFFVSFVSQKDKILVDSLIEGPPGYF